MARTLSESQFRVADYLREMASHVEREGGFFRGMDLSTAEQKAIISELRESAKKYEQRAHRNRSIGS